jgi:hypothetical protein
MSTIGATLRAVLANRVPALRDIEPFPDFRIGGTGALMFHLTMCITDHQTRKRMLLWQNHRQSTFNWPILVGEYARLQMKDTVSVQP